MAAQNSSVLTADLIFGAHASKIMWPRIAVPIYLGKLGLLPYLPWCNGLTHYYLPVLSWVAQQ